MDVTVGEYARALLENIDGCLLDAYALLGRGSAGRAGVLAATSLEEASKLRDLLELGLDRHEPARVGRRRLPHSLKQSGGFLAAVEAAVAEHPDTVQVPDDPAQALADFFEATKSAGQQGRAIRERGLYVDVTADGLQTPDQVETGDVADLLSTAKLVAGHLRTQVSSAYPGLV